MKKLFLFAFVLTLSQGYATVVVPKDALNPAHGTQKLFDRLFDYSVSDEGGWNADSSYVFNSKEYEANASKSYFIEYELKEGGIIDQKTATYLVYDAYNKCIELTQLNLPTIKDIWAKHNLDILMKPEISPNFGVSEKTATFKCHTKYSVKK